MRPNHERAETIAKLTFEGLSYKEISEKTGIPYGSISYYARGSFNGKKKSKEVSENNADRHLCLSCIYRSCKPNVNGCDYIEIERHSRGCSVENCTVYVKGRRRRVKV